MEKKTAEPSMDIIVEERVEIQKAFPVKIRKNF